MFVQNQLAHGSFLEDPKLELGRRQSTDFLALSFSAQDTVSHSYGAESEEKKLPCMPSKASFDFAESGRAEMAVK